LPVVRGFLPSCWLAANRPSRSEDQRSRGVRVSGLPCLRGFASVRARMRSLSRLFLLLPALWLVACSGAGGESASGSASSSAAAAMPTAAADPASKPFRMKSGDGYDTDEAKIKDKFGSRSPYQTDAKGKPMGDYKSAAYFDKANSQFNRGYEGKAYQAGEYKKKSFWGSKDYAKTVYGGNTDADGLRKPSRFQGDSAGESVKVARDGSRSYKTGDYGSGNSSETGKSLTKFAGAENGYQNAEFSDPEIVPWQQQHGMTVEESKSRMGR